MEGYMLKTLRISNNMKAKEISKKIGVSSAYISEMENLNKPVTYSVLKRYSEILDIPRSKIMQVYEQTESLVGLNKYQTTLLMFLRYYVYEKSDSDDIDNYLDSEVCDNVLTKK